MIPKTIHYCWIGGNPLPESAKKCIKSWKKYCPDYKIVEWNESNYDFTRVPYMKEALQAKKWGFAPDYARLDIVYTHGGIYLDTDVEIVKPFDPLTLMVRIEKVLKRVGKWNAVYRVRDVVVNTETHTVTKDGEPVELQPLEFDVLIALLRHKNMTVSRERLLSEVWGFDYLGETRMVDVKISALRKKLSLEDAIRAIPKLGYRLEER